MTRLARWVADPQGDRPAATVPAVEQRIADLRAEYDALTTAVGHVFAEKAVFVERHRGRLAKDAEKARRRAVERLQQAISNVEEARAEAVDCVAAERWAREFPGERAEASSLRLALTKGGRIAKAIPELKTMTVASHAFEWLREDARWLDSVLEAEQQKRGELDIREDAALVSTDEGAAALERERQRIIADSPRATRARPAGNPERRSRDGKAGNRDSVRATGEGDRRAAELQQPRREARRHNHPVPAHPAAARRARRCVRTTPGIRVMSTRR